MKLCFLTIIAVACSAVRAGELESSMTADPGKGPASFRFKGFTTTTIRTSTVFSNTVHWVRSTKTCKLAGTPNCDYNPPVPVVPNPPTVVVEPTSVHFPPSIGTGPIATLVPTVTATVTAQPLWQINVNKVQHPSVNLAQLVKPVDVSISAGLSATATSGRSALSDDAILVSPSAVNRMEMTASPEIRTARRVNVEASQLESEDEYELIGFTGQENLRFFKPKITIVNVRRTTVTIVSTATSTFPVVDPTDQVTIAYGGCIPRDAPLPLPDC